MFSTVILQTAKIRCRFGTLVSKLVETCRNHCFVSIEVFDLICDEHAGHDETKFAC